MKRLWIAFNARGSAVLVSEDVVAAATAADQDDGPLVSVLVDEGQQIPNAIRFRKEERALEITTTDPSKWESPK